MNVTQAHVSEVAERVSQAQQARQEKLQQVRTASQQLVGITFFQTMLQMAHNSSLKGEYGHGGRGEEVFTQQMDIVLAEKLAQSGRIRLADIIADRLTQKYSVDASEVISRDSAMKQTGYVEYR